MKRKLLSALLCVSMVAVILSVCVIDDMESDPSDETEDSDTVNNTAEYKKK